MKLNAAQVQQVEEQTGLEVVPESNPVTGKLEEVLGEHSFFLDSEGLSIVEPKEPTDSSGCVVVKLASWREDRTQLQTHSPKVLGTTINLAEASSAGGEGSEAS